MEDKEKIKEILLSDDVSNMIMDNISYILKIMPEIGSMINFQHNHPHHHLDVFGHTLLALENSKPDFEVRMALLLHDIGKPLSYQEDNKGVRHFHGHFEVSTKIATLILKRLEFEEEFCKNVLYLISSHDTIIDTFNLDNTPSLINKRLEVQYADAKAHAPSKVEMRIQVLDKIRQELIEKYNIV